MSANPAGIAEHLRFRREAERSGTLPAHYYFDPEIFAREKEEIWFKTWQFVGYLSDLEQPGDYITADLLDQKILIVRGKDRRLRAFYNVCMHRGHILAEGKGNKTILTCPFHAWSYDTTGALRAAGNAENVAGFRLEDFGLTEIRVETLLDMLVFVNLDPRAPTLASQIEGLEDQVRETVRDFDQMVFARRDRFDVKANRKFIFDQLECYHCPVVHPEVTGTVDWSLRRHWEYGVWQRHNQRLQSDSDTSGFGRAYQIRDEDPQKGSNIWYLWPNLLLMSHWGVGNFKVLVARPLDLDNSLELLDCFSVNDPPSEEEIAGMNRFRDTANLQDIRCMEQQHAGIRSRGFVAGRLMVDAERSPRSEHATHHFDRLVWEALNGTNYV